jgi:cytochrome c oxidase subunit II
MSRNLIAGAVVVGMAIVATFVVFFVGFRNGPPPADLNNGEDMVAAGEAIYQQQCAGCHTTDGSSSVGPTFEGLYGSEVTMDDGSTVVVDEDHLWEAITDPRATTREGYPDVMPSFARLNDNEINGLLVFIRSLE